MLPGQPFPPKPNRQKLPGYDTVMLIYLLTGAAILPILVGTLLIEVGLLQEMSESTTPAWIYGYFLFVTFGAGFVLICAWIPAIYICIKYRKQWRAVVPAAAILVLTAGLFASMSSSEMSTIMEYAMAFVATFYAIAAFGIGLEWLLKRVG